MGVLGFRPFRLRKKRTVDTLRFTLVQPIEPGWFDFAFIVLKRPTREMILQGEGVLESNLPVGQVMLMLDGEINDLLMMPLGLEP